MLVAYITFNGNTEEAFNFYKTALEGEFVNVQRMGDGPQGAQLPDAEKKKIMHISLEAPHGVRLMGSDYMDFGGMPFQPGNNFSLSLHPDNEALADKLFANLSAGGTITMPMAKAPWGDYFGMFHDKFGMLWMINCPAK
ncbi:VOC family protein [Ferruginibacter sp.]